MKGLQGVLWLLILAGCTSGDPDALPNDPMRVLKTKHTAPVPTGKMADQSGQSQQHLDRGREVFVAKCTECHEPRIAVSPEDPSWHPTMRGMAWNADLSAADERALIDYLRAAAKE
jgi:cytochrome c5